VVKPGTRLWHRHPAVRAQKLTFGEKAADWLKHWFGTWIALGLVTVWIAAWIALQRTSISWDLYPFILLNLCLSCLAAVQGIILHGDIHLTGLSQVRALATVGVPAGGPGSVDGLVPLVAWVASAWAVG
jgi:hypothetical protein